MYTVQLQSTTAQALLLVHRALNRLERDDPFSSGQLKLRLLRLKRGFQLRTITEEEFSHALQALPHEPIAHAD